MTMGDEGLEGERGWTMQLAQPLEVLDAALPFVSIMSGTT